MKQLVVRILFKMYKLTFAFFGTVLPKNDKLIIFESFLGKQYSDNPRAIYEYIHKYHEGYTMYWSVDKNYRHIFANHNILQVKRLSIKWLFLMTSAKYWVYNSRLPVWVPKPKKTVYLQTWHGTPLKRLALDMDEVHMAGSDTEVYKKAFIKSASKWDYLISPNHYSTEIFRRAFHFNKKMIESGYPRNDFLVNANNAKTIAEIKKRCNLPTDKKVILYSPTWRDNQYYGVGKYKLDIEMDLAMMQKELGKDYIILLRLHYLVAENLDLSAYDGFVYDMTFHEDIRDLYLIADMLVTDYSSVFFDFAILRRPIIFFVYDLEEYRDKLRGFYFDFEQKAPGPLVKTTGGIVDVVKNIEQNGYTPSEIAKAFHERFCYLEDGKATKRVVNEVFDKRA